MADVIVILIIIAAVAAALRYIIKAKRRGVKCIGCSEAAACGSRGNSSDLCTCCGNVDDIVQQIKNEKNM